MRFATLALLALVLMCCCPAPPATWAQHNWVAYDFPSTGFVAYDFDSDGMLELIALPSYVVDNYVTMSSPYPQAYSGFTVDLDLDGSEELVLQHLSTFYVYKGMTAVASYHAPGRVNIDPWRRAFAAGNTVVYNMTTITLRDATSPVFPVTTSSRAYMVYLAGGALKIADSTGWSTTAYSGDMVSILGVGLFAGSFYVLGRARSEGSVLVVYDMYRRSTTVTGFAIEFDRVITFMYMQQAFIATSGEYVYRVYADKAVLEYVGDVLWFDGSYMYIYSGERRAVDVYAPVLSKVVALLSVPAKPAVLGGRYPIIGFSDGSGTYVLVNLPKITMRLRAPQTVYAGEKFSYSLEVSNAINYTLLFDGRPIPPSGYLSINASGEYRFTASATNGVLTEVTEFRIRALPRPINIRLHVEGTPRAFSRVNVSLRVTDAITGAAVRYAWCTLVVGSGTPINVTAWTPAEVVLSPPDLSRGSIPVSATCGDGLYYERRAYSDTLSIYAAKARPDIEYLGEGTIRVRLVAPDNRTEAVGRVTIYLNNRYIDTVPLPALITGIPAGRNTIRLRFLSDSPVFASADYTIEVTYYENVSAVPEEALPHVYVADVVKYINATETVRVTETVHVPVHVPVEVPVLDTVVTTSLACVAAVAGVVAGMLVPKLLSRLKAAQAEEQQEVGAEPA